MLRAVVVAAGKGSRLHPYTDGVAKCLLEIAPGVTLLDFILRQLREAGVEDIVVATMPKYVEKIRERVGVGVEVRAVEAEAEDFGNLYTFYLAARDGGVDRFLAVMSDHIFESEVLVKLLEDGGEKAVTLCLDRSPKWKDAVEGLRIRLEDVGVKEAGKGILPFEGVDTGLFMISSRGMRLVEDVVTRVGASANFVDLVNLAAEAGDVGYVDVSGKIWMDVDTPEDLEEARRLYWEVLRRSLIKRGDGPVSRYFNRPLSTRVSIFLYRRVPKLTANQMTVISFLTGIISSALFFAGNPVGGGLAAQASSVLDGVDGELARLRREVSEFGRIFDMVLDRLVDVSIVLGLGFHSLSTLPPLLALILTSLSAAGVVIISYISSLFTGKARENLRRGFPWATRDVRLFLIMIGGLAQQPLIPLTFCAFAPLVFAAKAIFVMSRQLKRAGGKPLERRPPTPIIETKRVDRRGKAAENLISLASNSIYLIISVYILHLISYMVEDFRLVKFGAITLQASHILSIMSLVVVILFGYRILIALRFLLESAAGYLLAELEITRTIYQRAAADIFYLVSLTLVLLGVFPLLEEISNTFAIFRMAVIITFLTLFTIIIYDLMRIFRRNLRGFWDRLLDRVSEALERRAENR